MKKETMGNGAAAGIQTAHAGRVFAWLWHSWLEAQRHIPMLRWLGLAACLAAGTAVYRAAAEGHSGLDMAIDGMVALLFVSAVPAIFYLLFEIYRRHRSDAIFDSKRLAHLIQRIAKEEIEAAEEAKLAAENTLLMRQEDRSARR